MKQIPMGAAPLPPGDYGSFVILGPDDPQCPGCIAEYGGVRSTRHRLVMCDDHAFLTNSELTRLYDRFEIPPYLRLFLSEH